MEGDSKFVLDVVFGGCATPWRLNAIMVNVRYLCGFFLHITAKHVG